MKLRPEIKRRVRELRGNATPAERKLWFALRNLNRNGFHFRRQVPFDGYICDFAEHRRRIVIELDGDTHSSPDAIRHDAHRTVVISKEGYRVLRFWNAEVHANVDAVIAKILSEIGSSRPPPP
jgi:very-short-patch-repair endonuclease